MSEVKTVYQDDEQTLVIEVIGNFCLPLLEKFKQAYFDISHKPSKYILDFTKVEYIDSSGINMLFDLKKFAGDDAANIRLIHLKPDIKGFLSQAKLNTVFNFD